MNLKIYFLLLLLNHNKQTTNYKQFPIYKFKNKQLFGFSNLIVIC